MCWVSRKQTSVALSSMEAKYAALSGACKELLRLRRLLEDFQEIQPEPTIVYEDNRSCNDFVQPSRRSKHIDTWMPFAKDSAEKGVVAYCSCSLLQFVQYCSSEEMEADMLTKPLASVKLKVFAEAIGLVVAD